MESMTAGTVIADKYQIERLLGKGGMGHVYLASHLRMPEFRVALKTLDPALTSKVENKEKFRNEVIAGYRVNHPNVVQMYEYFDLGELQAFAMEFVDGATLAQVLTEGPLSPDVTISFIKQMAMGLEALHRAGTYHRDLKPENVLVGDDGRVKLTDFGVARIRGGVSIEMEGMLIGTPNYVPPEYVETGESDHRGDIYALGVMAYEMFAGVAPFVSPTRNSLLKERLKPHGLDLAQRAPDLPQELVAIVERCLAIAPIQRYPRAADLAEDLGALQRTYVLSDTVDCSSKVSNTTILWGEFVTSFRKQQQEKEETEHVAGAEAPRG
jgi:serine/threonine protein kinase